MTQSISEVVHELAEVTIEEKDLKERKEQLRQELFIHGTLDYKDKEYLLPTTTVTVPDTFWFTTGMDPLSFVLSRFPTWDVLEQEKNAALNTTTFVLRKNPRYMPFKWEDDSVKLSKSVTEPTPDIDWETLKAERPDIFDTITREVVSYELDGEALEKLMEEDQEIISILTRHTKYGREPQQRVGIKNVE